MILEYSINIITLLIYSYTPFSNEGPNSFYNFREKGSLKLMSWYKISLKGIPLSRNTRSHKKRQVKEPKVRCSLEEKAVNNDHCAPNHGV